MAGASFRSSKFILKKCSALTGNALAAPICRGQSGSFWEKGASQTGPFRRAAMCFGKRGGPVGSRLVAQMGLARKCRGQQPQQTAVLRQTGGPQGSGDYCMKGAAFAWHKKNGLSRVTAYSFAHAG